MDIQYYGRNGRQGSHFSSTAVYARPLVHNPMPASHNYISNGTTEKAKGYDAWVASREKEDSMYVSNGAYGEADSDEKVFHAAEATKEYSNMRQALREADEMMARKPAVSEDEYEDHDQKGFAATEASKGLANMRQAGGERDSNMFVRNPMFSEGDQYSNKMYSAESGNGYSNVRQAARQKEDNMFAFNPAISDVDYGQNMYSPEAGRGYMNIKQTARQKEDLYVASPVLDDEYSHQMYSADAGRGYMNIRQGGRQKEQTVYALNPALSDDEYGHRMYPAEAGRGYMNVRQAARRKEDNMFALNPVLSDDHEYNHTVYSTQPVQGYPNMRHDGRKENMFISNQAFGRADFGDEVYYTPSHMEPTNTRKAVACGPWGGNTGNLFDDGVFTGIREIQLTRSGGIVSIRVCYDMEGKAVWGDKNGGSHGMKMDKIILDCPSEYLTHISGYYGSMILRGPTVLKSLTFHTNKRKYGPFGDEQGISFSSAGPREGKIVGFSGRIKGWYVESIGVHVMEGRTSRPAYDAFDMNGLRICEVGMAREQEQWSAEKVHMRMNVNKFYGY